MLSITLAVHWQQTLENNLLSCSLQQYVIYLEDVTFQPSLPYAGQHQVL